MKGGKQAHGMIFQHNKTQKDKISLIFSLRSKSITLIFIIYRKSTPKLEVATCEEFNPLLQDTRKNKDTGLKELRFYGKETLFNYGMIPQTWENNKVLDKATGYYGDNDPLDIIEVSDKQLQVGSLHQVKVLGSLCLIDQGELDWKLISINVDYAQKNSISNIEDFQKFKPGLIDQIREWFRIIKTFDGKPENTFGYNGEIIGVEKTLEVIKETQDHYQDLMVGKVENESSFWLGPN